MREEIEQEEEIKVLLVGADTGEEEDFDHSMEELKSLAEACNKTPVGTIVQRMEAINKAYYIGTGKVQEVKNYAVAIGASEVIFDNTLTPSQMRNLSDALDLNVIDRTNLILDIFALRAQTKEAKLQVESARLQYMLPRLIGMRENLGRQGGTGGSMSNKGAGETKLELDRRKIEHRISELKKELELVIKNRQTMRKKRDRSGIPQVALVGYTNAGKSTIMNRLVDRYGENKEKTVFEKDMLFATLDTNVRKIDTGNRMPFFLSDTVGFIHKLPHGLIEAFKSTLEEVQYADLCIQVVDFSDEHYRQHMQVTTETLKEIGAGGVPMVVVYNKADRCPEITIPKLVGDAIYISAKEERGLDELIAFIQKKVYGERNTVEFLFPYDKGGEAAALREKAYILEEQYLENGLALKVECSDKVVKEYEKYRKNGN